MNAALETAPEGFTERRKSYPDYSPLGRDRRQFGANYDDLSADGRDIGVAIDRYKLERHRRFINADELLSILVSLGYQRAAAGAATPDGPFADRRQRSDQNPVGVERRQFAGNEHELSEAGRELAGAIDQYKLVHRRRVVSPDELIEILKTLGYAKRA
jgi:hypothetical protein